MEWQVLYNLKSANKLQEIFSFNYVTILGYKKTTAYHLQMNAQVERYHKMLLSVIQMHTALNQRIAAIFV